MTICATDPFTQLISLVGSLIGKIFLFGRCTRPNRDKEPAKNHSRRLDGLVTSGALTRLYVFGPLDALQSRFVSYR
jgi:hypothetical protein